MNLADKFNEYKAIIDPALERYLDTKTDEGFDCLLDAAEYSLMSGGKRIRPVILLEFCRVCGGDVSKALPFACALEMVHTYSLIHDDMPFMDDDDMRRGLPSCHKAYGVPIAVLAGDGLLTLAFEVAARNEGGIPPEAALKCIRLLGKAAGMNGMVAGQVLDIRSEFEHVSTQKMELMHRLKTACMFQAACEMGCVAAGRDDEDTLSLARDYGEYLGFAFQVQDDIIDAENDGASHDNGQGGTFGRKITFTSMFGLDECRKLSVRLTNNAIDTVKGLEGSEFLEELARSLVGRKK